MDTPSQALRNPDPRARFRGARFHLSAATLTDCPADVGAEVAFAGRSNAGKSSALNALTGQNKLARTSKTPGRTRLLNFFTLDEQQRLVDLPGYGYARVPKAMKADWDRHLANYLQARRSLRGLILLMDIRHPLQEFDRHLAHWAHQAELPVHLLLTKADKLNRGPAQATLLSVRKELARLGQNQATAQTFSALAPSGLEELAQKLCEWLDNPD